MHRTKDGTKTPRFVNRTLLGFKESRKHQAPRVNAILLPESLLLTDVLGMQSVIAISIKAVLTGFASRRFSFLQSYETPRHGFV
jgi:hypothetical protein